VGFEPAPIARIDNFLTIRPRAIQLFLYLAMKAKLFKERIRTNFFSILFLCFTTSTGSRARDFSESGSERYSRASCIPAWSYWRENQVQYILSLKCIYVASDPEIQLTLSRVADPEYSCCLKTLPWIRESECVYWSENRKFLDFLGINLCEESIARIPEAWKCFSEPESGNWNVCIEEMTNFYYNTSLFLWFRIREAFSSFGNARNRFLA
jgi:hypothetical protein